jgi:hypothetical protein
MDNIDSMLCYDSAKPRHVGKNGGGIFARAVQLDIEAPGGANRRCQKPAGRNDDRFGAGANEGLINFYGRLLATSSLNLR